MLAAGRPGRWRDGSCRYRRRRPARRWQPRRRRRTTAGSHREGLEHPEAVLEAALDEAIRVTSRCTNCARYSAGGWRSRVARQGPPLGGHRRQAQGLEVGHQVRGLGDSDCLCGLPSRRHRRPTSGRRPRSGPDPPGRWGPGGSRAGGQPPAGATAGARSRAGVSRGRGGRVSRLDGRGGIGFQQPQHPDPLRLRLLASDATPAAPSPAGRRLGTHPAHSPSPRMDVSGAGAGTAVASPSPGRCVAGRTRSPGPPGRARTPASMTNAAPASTLPAHSRRPRLRRTRLRT